MNVGEKLSSFISNYSEFLKNLGSEFAPFNEKIATINMDSGELKEAVSFILNVSSSLLIFLKSKREELLSEKTSISQKLITQFSTNDNSAFDVSNNVRILIQKKILNFEASLIEKVNGFSRPVVGAIWKKLNQWIEDEIGISSLIVIEKSHENLLILSKDAVDAIFRKLSEELIKFAKDTVESLHQCISSTSAEIRELTLMANINAYPTTNIMQLNFHKYETIILSSLRIEMPYQGSMNRKNLRSLIFEMRSFSMIYMLILSSFGVGRFIAKDDGMKTISYIISLILLFTGILYTYAKSQDSKEEKLNDELTKAQDRILVETKRGVNEFISEWRSFVLVSLKNSLSEISQFAENEIRRDAKSKSDNLVAERLKLSQQSQMLDTKEKNYQELIKKSETWNGQIILLANEINNITPIQALVNLKSSNYGTIH